MRRKAFDSTLFKRAVCVDPPHTCELYSIQGRIRPLYKVNSCVGLKKERRRLSTPNFWEADLASEVICAFQLKSLENVSPRILSEGEGSINASLNSRGKSIVEVLRVDMCKNCVFDSLNLTKFLIPQSEI